MDAMLAGGAAWAVARGWGRPEDLARTEEQGRMAGGLPGFVSDRAKRRQQDEMGTLGSGNHYLEVQEVADILDAEAAGTYGLATGEAVVTIHCGSRGLGHQIGTEFLRDMALVAPLHGIHLPDRELACAPIRSGIGERYLGAMRAAINCALANRQILTHLGAPGFRPPPARGAASTCCTMSRTTRASWSSTRSPAVRRSLYVHRKGATRAFGPGHTNLPHGTARGRPAGADRRLYGHQVVGAGGDGERRGAVAVVRLSRRRARHEPPRGAPATGPAARWSTSCAGADIVVRSPSMRGVAEEAPGAYKDVAAVVAATEQAGLARRVAQLKPRIVIKG